MTHNPENTTPPPPVEVSLWSRHDHDLTVSPEACSAVLRSFGVEDPAIAATLVAVVADNRTERFQDPRGSGGIITHPNATDADEIGGVGQIWLRMGSVEAARFTDEARAKCSDAKLRSSLLVDGLSNRADLAIMGKDALEAEQQAAEEQLRKAPIRKAAGKFIGSSAVGIAADIAAVQYDIIPTPAGWIAGAVGLVAGAWWAKSSAVIQIRQKTIVNDIHQQWPAQKRADQRVKAYLDDPDAPLLLLKNTGTQQLPS